MSATMRGDGWREERADGMGEKPLAVIETDLFCKQCGYNLHTQRVWRDARLGVMVCRCPECGMHEAADVASGIGNMWSRQFGQFLLTLWLAAITAAAWWTISSLSNDQLTYVSWRLYYPQYTATGATLAWLALFLIPAFILDFSIATTLSIMLLHRRRAWRYFSLSFPLCALIWSLVAMEYRLQTNNSDEWRARVNLAEILSYQISVFMLGAVLGRSFVRLIAAWALPAWALRAMAFLWLVEGKRLPARARK